ncbi:hypothetical protein [Oceanisphaera sp. IT1-181]|uniref:hypothetical protein n=1 Tax=Oceanisphaera sp. IT1-181 TaxID=3081199 RepID=UPI0029C9BFA3|nr:hypothetical protein [Oceanisphaera sp. IT1-181]
MHMPTSLKPFFINILQLYSGVVAVGEYSDKKGAASLYSGTDAVNNAHYQKH